MAPDPASSSAPPRYVLRMHPDSWGLGKVGMNQLGCLLAGVCCFLLMIALLLDAPPALLVVFPALWLFVMGATSRRSKRANQVWQAAFFDDRVEVEGLPFLSVRAPPTRQGLRYADVTHLEREQGFIRLSRSLKSPWESLNCPVPPELIDALWRDLLRWIEATPSDRLRLVVEEGRLRYLPAGAGLEQLAPGRRVQGAWSLDYAGSDRFRVLSSEGSGVLMELQLDSPDYNKSEGNYSHWEARSSDGTLLALSRGSERHILIGDGQGQELARLTKSRPEGGDTRLEISTPDGLFTVQGAGSALTLEKDGEVLGSFESAGGLGFRQGKLEQAVPYMAFVIIVGSVQGALSWR